MTNPRIILGSVMDNPRIAQDGPVSLILTAAREAREARPTRSSCRACKNASARFARGLPFIFLKGRQGEIHRFKQFSPQD